jgi:hypothetical protein
MASKESATANDARFDRDLLPPETIGKAPAVQPLMMRADDLEHVR